MRVLLTGAAGFIGSHLSEALLLAGHQVTGLDCFTDSAPRELKGHNLETSLAHPSYEFVEDDLLTADLSQLLEAKDIVFHLAAQAGVAASWTSFGTYLQQNIQTTQRLLQAIGGGTPVVFTSSSSVYGEVASGLAQEDSPLQPNSPYGITKVACEQLLQLHHRMFGLPYAILRPFTVYGPRQRPDMMVSRLMTAALAGGPFTVTGDGHQQRDMTFVSDLVDALLAMTSLDLSAGLLINVAGGGPHSMWSLIEQVAVLTDSPVDARTGPGRLGDVSRTHADTSRARSLLGWQPRVRLAEGLQRQIATLQREPETTGPNTSSR